jgi:hypothetical protein
MLSATAAAVGTSRGGAGRPRRCQSSPARCEQCSVAEAGRGAGEEIRAGDHLLSAERPEYAPGVVVYQRVQVVGSVALFAFSVRGVCMALGAPVQRSAFNVLRPIISVWISLVPSKI